MKFTVMDHQQRSPEWYMARAGRLTGSCAAAILSKGKGSAESVQRRDYRLQLACERLTGIPQDGGFVNEAMQRGIDLEQIAFAAYEAATGNVVRSTGFLSADEIMAGCSLDGAIEDFEGILEMKCPKTATHLGYLRNPPSLVDAYMPQIIHNIWVSGAKWCDIMSFDDRLPKELRLCKMRFLATDTGLEEYERAALQFLSEVDKEVEAIKALAA